MSHCTDLISSLSTAKSATAATIWYCARPPIQLSTGATSCFFSQPPREGDYSKWLDLFALEIGVLPETEHQVFGWDSVDGEEGVVQPFLRRGFSQKQWRRSDVQRTAQPRQACSAGWRRFAALKTEAVGAGHRGSGKASRDLEHEESGYREFRQRQISFATGRWSTPASVTGTAPLPVSNWWQIWGFSTTRASAAINPSGHIPTSAAAALPRVDRRSGSPRQSRVRPAHAGHCCRRGPPTAARLYKSLGFQPTEKQAGLERWPRIEDPLASDGG